jgi:hypothetical protein
MPISPGSVSITDGDGEIVAHEAEAAGGVEAMRGVMGDDAARLLPAMLQRMQAQRHETGRIGHAGHAEDAAFLAELVVINRVEWVAERVG